MSVAVPQSGIAVLGCGSLAEGSVVRLCRRFGAAAICLPAGSRIPGSYWGDPEAGLVGRRVYFRDDTPAHSLLHELSHYVCMQPFRRRCLDTDAGGDDAEECAVCYLEVLLAEYLPPFGSARCLADMDAWGYSFREGSARAWFEGDGRDARAWLISRGLIDACSRPTWRLRGDSRQSLVGFGASP